MTQGSQGCCPSWKARGFHFRCFGEGGILPVSHSLAGRSFFRFYSSLIRPSIGHWLEPFHIFEMMAIGRKMGEESRKIILVPTSGAVYFSDRFPQLLRVTALQLPRRF